MFQIQRFKTVFILAIMPLMSLNSGKLKPTALDRMITENNRLKDVLKCKESERQLLETQISYKDSISRSCRN